MEKNSVAQFEHGTVFGATVVLILHTGGGDVGMTEHLLHYTAEKLRFRGNDRCMSTPKYVWAAELKPFC